MGGILISFSFNFWVCIFSCDFYYFLCVVCLFVLILIFCVFFVMYILVVLSFVFFFVDTFLSLI